MLKTTQTSVGPFPAITRSTTLQDLLGFAASGGFDTSSQPDTPAEPSANAAVARCIHAYEQAFHKAVANGASDYSAGNAAERAFRRALPLLVGRDNIRDFIACVAHGMLINAIETAAGSRLLYAAQIAHSTSQLPPSRQPGRPSKQQPDSKDAQTPS